MTAMACMRIVPGASPGSNDDELAVMVSKIVLAFLETRWAWPRRYGEIAPYAFLLADPRTTHLDPVELVALSEQLELKLFGPSGGGSIGLATLEGDSDAVTRFAAVEPDLLRQVLAEGGCIEGLIGRITQITSAGVRVVSPPGESGPVRPVTPASASRTLRGRDPTPDPEIETTFQGVWYAPKGGFIGSGISANRKGARAAYSTTDGQAHLPGDAAAEFDVTCLEAAPAALVDSHGLMFVPISFSSAVQKTARDRYRDALEGLAQVCRPRLAAAVYDVPRAPSFAAIEQLRTFLKPYFSFIDLQTSDPDFQIDALAVAAVASVTLSMPDTDDGARLAAARRFAGHRENYKKHRIWQGVTNVRTRRELAACLQLGVPFLSGRAVSDNLATPAVPVHLTAEGAPLRVSCP